MDFTKNGWLFTKIPLKPQHTILSCILVRDVSVNYIWWWGSIYGNLDNMNDLSLLPGQS